MQFYSVKTFNKAGHDCGMYLLALAPNENITDFVHAEDKYEIISQKIFVSMFSPMKTQWPNSAYHKYSLQAKALVGTLY